MLGILCPLRQKKYYSLLFKKFLEENHFCYEAKLFVFCIQDIDFIEKTANGILVEKEKVTDCSSSLPQLVFNLTKSKSRKSQKELLAIIDLKDINIINYSNVFERDNILGILRTDKKTYAFTESFAEETLVLYKGKRSVLRGFVFLDSKGNLKLLGKTQKPYSDEFKKRKNKKINGEFFKIANLIFCFLKDINLIYIDLIIDCFGKAYFYSCGGADESIFSDKRLKDIRDMVIYNILKFSNEIKE